jgi:hypothetical protein
MRSGSIALVLSFACVGASVAIACSGDNTTTLDLPDSSHPNDSASQNDSASSQDSSNPQDGGSDTNTPLDAADAAPAPAIIYGHSPDTLYTFDVNAQKVSIVAKFGGLTSQVIDLAIDGANHGYVTTFDGFYSVDLTSAACTLILKGAYPNSLSFVPKGTLDQSAEALVGYNGATYVRIDTTTGKISNVGSLTNGYTSSGDIVSVKGGGTFLTVTGNGCADCLLQVDPVTGNVVQNYGDVKHKQVYGLAYWAGVVYGFDNGGHVFSVIGNGNAITVTDLVADAGNAWYGAGSTTNAPALAADGGGITIK